MRRQMLTTLLLLLLPHRFGIEQEYTLLNPLTKWPLGWPDNGYPAPQVGGSMAHVTCQTLDHFLCCAVLCRAVI